MGGYGIRLILWLLFGAVHAHHPHRTEWPAGRPAFRPTRLSAGRSATSAIAGGPSLSSAAGRRSSMSITVSAAADPFNARRTPRVGGPLIQLPRSSGRGSTRKIVSNGPMTGIPGFQTPLRQGSSSGRGPGYLVLPASALIRFLASRTSNAGSIPTYPDLLRTQSVPAPLGLGGGVMGTGVPAPAANIPGLTFGNVRHGIGQRGAGHSINIVPIGQAHSRHAFPGSPGISGISGGAAVVAPGPSGVTFLGSQASQLAGLANALASSGLPIVLSGSPPPTNVLNNQATVVQPSSTNGNSANNIIIGDPAPPGSKQGNQLVIGGNGGTITIRGDLLGGGPYIEPEEIETEESRKNSSAASGSHTHKLIGGNQTIVLDSGGGKTQTIVIGGGGGTLSISDKTPGGVNIPGNATFILKAGTTPRIIDV